MKSVVYGMILVVSVSSMGHGREPWSSGTHVLKVAGSNPSNMDIRSYLFVVKIIIFV